MMTIKKIEFNMLPVNCYVLSDETKEAVIIDAGCYYTDEQQALKNYIESNGLTLKHLICTHLHFDHIFGNPFVLRTFGIKAEANPKDMPWMANIKQRISIFGLSTCDDPVPLGRELEEGDEVTFGTHTLKALAVPGHSPGSLAFYCEEEKVVFTGDALFAGSIGRADFIDGDESLLIRSVKEKLLTLPDETVVLTGHGEKTTIGNEKRFNIFLR